MTETAAIDPRALLHPFETELWLPRYPGGRWSDWSISTRLTAGSRSYWGEAYPILGIPVLSGPTGAGSATWMSIVPMEVESQEIGIAAARGHTVVLGLGMGWCAGNVALKAAVTRVTVIERDPDVIALIAALGVLEQLPADARDKIWIVQADAFEWRPDSPVDSLQADIWAKVVEPERWEDVRRLNAAIAPAALYFWGQEMELWRLACRAAGREPAVFDCDRLDALVAGTGLPLVMSRDPALPARIAAGARWWTPRQDGWWDARSP